MSIEEKRMTKSDRTRETILRAAEKLFAENGYERATVRDIASEAGIDPAMIIRYFGSKEGLFARAAQFDLKLPDLAALPPDSIGETLVGHFLDVWENAEGQGGLAVLLRSAASNEQAAERLREVFAGQVIPALMPIAEYRHEMPTRAGLISSQLLGLAFCRYVFKLPPVAAMSRETIVREIGRTIQRYTTDPLWDGSKPA